MWMFCSSDHSEFWCYWRRSWGDMRGMETTAAGVVSTVLFAVNVEDCTVRLMWWRRACPDKPVCFPPAVALGSTDRCEGSSSLSSAAWLTSVMPFTGCHLASCGQDDFPSGWWAWWAPSHLWLVWSRWKQATATRQREHSRHHSETNRADSLMTEWMMIFVDGKCWVKGW